VSTVDDIKNRKRQQKVVTPSQILTEIVEEEEENKVDLNEERKERRKLERKRVSFDLRTDLHKELKLQAILQEKNIYILIEEALERYLKEHK